MPLSLLMFLACSSVVPEDTNDPVDKLAGKADVRVGAKVGDVFGLQRSPEHDDIVNKREAYIRPAEETKWESTRYLVREGIVEAIAFAYTPGRACRAELETMVQFAGPATSSETDASGRAVHRWRGALTEAEVRDTGETCVRTVSLLGR